MKKQFRTLRKLMYSMHRSRVSGRPQIIFGAPYRNSPPPVRIAPSQKGPTHLYDWPCADALADAMVSAVIPSAESFIELTEAAFDEACVKYCLAHNVSLEYDPGTVDVFDFLLAYYDEQDEIAQNEYLTTFQFAGDIVDAYFNLSNRHGTFPCAPEPLLPFEKDIIKRALRKMYTCPGNDDDLVETLKFGFRNLAFFIPDAKAEIIRFCFAASRNDVSHTQGEEWQDASDYHEVMAREWEALATEWDEWVEEADSMGYAEYQTAPGRAAIYVRTIRGLSE